eukprot:s2142_g16.t1
MVQGGATSLTCFILVPNESGLPELLTQNGSHSFAMPPSRPCRAMQRLGLRWKSATQTAAVGAGLEGNRYFTKTQEWFQVESDGIGTIGITQVAQRALGEIVYCRLPQEGTRFKVMDTVATLEAVKTVGEVHSPVAGEVIEVNTRLEQQPCLVTHSPLTDGWLLRLAFNGKIPRYLRRSSAVPRWQIEPLLADVEGLKNFLQEKLAQDGENTLEELTFANLGAFERSYVHKAAQELGLFTASYGTGAGRQLLLRRRPFKTAEDEDAEDAEDAEDGEDADDGEDGEAEKPEWVPTPEPLKRLPRNRKWRKVRLLQR